MSPRDDVIYTNRKTPPFSGYRAERKIPFFWIILVVVSALAAGLVYFVVRTGSIPAPDGERTEENAAQKEAPTEEPKEAIGDEPRESAKARPPEENIRKIRMPADISARIHAAESLISSGNFLEARKMLREMRRAAVEDVQALQKLEELLGKVNIEIFKSDVPSPEKKLYTIEKGDVLIKLAGRFNTTVEAIQTANRIPLGSHKIFPGKTLCIYEGDWKIIVSKSKKKLLLMDGDEFFKAYKVGIGRQGRTPSGEFEISLKQMDPVWYSEGKAIAFGDPKNILGTRWLALAPTGATDKNLRGYGIHGTWEPESVGHATSNGCVRLLNKDIEELFAIVPQRTAVIIED